LVSDRPTETLLACADHCNENRSRIVGAINSTGGLGGLMVFPAPIVFGIPKIAGNRTNAVGRTLRCLAILNACRRELAHQRTRLANLTPASSARGVGVVALEFATAGALRAVAPALVAANTEHRA
jgi:hypothetical protein